MTLNKRFYYILVLSLAAVFISCRSQKEVTYFQPVEDSIQTRLRWENMPNRSDVSVTKYEPIIRSNDILKIYVSSINREASSFFNPLINSDAKVDDPQAYGYLVDAKGFIEMPILGQVKVEGLTVPMIRDTLKAKLSRYLENPSVRVIFDNFKVTVLGDVTRPGIYSVSNERLTIPEALGLAGDLTIYANRKTILVIREENGKRQFANIDLTKRDIFESPYYFLHPNDIVYVEPVKGKIAASDNFYRLFPIIITSLTLISVIVLRVNQLN